MIITFVLDIPPFNAQRLYDGDGYLIPGTILGLDEVSVVGIAVRRQAKRGCARRAGVPAVGYVGCKRW